ncbi:type II toxin-antitoxin system RelE/ParE family toxin [Psychroflexus maritimus]|uniref:type II toxin-antitoxin system RelE/ParE family toxin n=1 Tax=Psychroflexus maritimus TaxID=2714865 RepID=UPI001CB7312D|nr:type II toxin-antitoxin system RelE/ParE family toxin [Psychroflexus maritimus]
MLKSQNYSGRMISEIQNENIREILQGNYRIIYRVVNKNRIDILTVHHSSRDLRKRKI